MPDIPDEVFDQLEREMRACRHPFDDVTYLGGGRWSCGRCGALVDRAKKRREVDDEWICPRCLKVYPEPVDPCASCAALGYLDDKDCDA